MSYRLTFAALLLVVSLFNLAGDTAEKPMGINPLLVSAPIPSVTLTDMDGNSMDLAKQVAEKPSILIFYRGGW